jgi:hypothetical protein
MLCENGLVLDWNMGAHQTHSTACNKECVVHLLEDAKETAKHTQQLFWSSTKLPLISLHLPNTRGTVPREYRAKHDFKHD